MEFNQIISPRKDFDELLEWLQEKLVVTEVELSEFGKFFEACMIKNAVNAITNEDASISEKSLEFKCFNLEKVPGNEGYYAAKASNEEFVYVVLERKTGYMLSNSGKLHLELVIERGVAQEDIDNHSVYMQYYLDCMDSYQKQDF